MRRLLLVFAMGIIPVFPITLKAVPTGDLFSGLFRLLDSDKSGYLSEPEWRRFRNAVVADKQGIIQDEGMFHALRLLGGSELNPLLKKALKSGPGGHPFDVDEDGLLELEDLDRFFFKFDRNQDRRIDLGEMPAKPAAPRHPP